MKKILLITISIFWIYSVKSYAQESSSAKAYTENLQITTDRDLYLCGSELVFKVRAKPDEILSKIVYVELFNQENKAVVRGKYRFLQNKAEGIFTIPEELFSDYYYLRAYTNFQKNSSPFVLAAKPITIINPGFPYTKETDNNENKLTIVPENGFLYPEIENRIALRLSPDWNEKLHELQVIKGDSTPVKTLPVKENTLYFLRLKPEKNKSYKVKAVLKNGFSFEQKIPQKENNKAYLSYETKNSLLSIKLLDAESQNFTLLVKDETFKTVHNIKSADGNSLQMPLYKLPEGLLYLVIKTNKDDVLAVKPVLNRPKNEEIISGRLNKRSYSPKETAELEMNFSEEQIGKNYSVIVRKKRFTEGLPYLYSYQPFLLTNLLNSEFLNTRLEQDIKTSLLLNEAFYNSEEFKNELLKKPKLSYIPEIRDISLTGKLENAVTGEAVSQKAVIATTCSGKNQIHKTFTDEKGEFYFILNHLTGKEKLAIATAPIDSVKTKIRVNTDFTNNYPTLNKVPFFLDSLKIENIRKLYVAAQLRKVFPESKQNYITDTVYKPVSVKYSQHTVFLKDFIDIPVMNEVFDEIVPYVTTRKEESTYVLNVYNDIEEQIYKNALVLVDGVPVFDMNQIMKIKPELISRINVTNQKRYIGSNSIEGLVSIITKTDDFAGIELPKETIFIDFNTTLPQNKLQTKHKMQAGLPYFNDILLWQIKKVKKENKIQFFTSDLSGEFEIIVRELSSGKLLNYTNFEVR